MKIQLWSKTNGRKMGSYFNSNFHNIYGFKVD